MVSLIDITWFMSVTEAFNTLCKLSAVFFILGIYTLLCFLLTVFNTVYNHQ